MRPTLGVSSSLLIGIPIGTRPRSCEMSRTWSERSATGSPISASTWRCLKSTPLVASSTPAMIMPSPAGSPLRSALARPRTLVAATGTRTNAPGITAFITSTLPILRLETPNGRVTTLSPGPTMPRSKLPQATTLVNPHLRRYPWPDVVTPPRARQRART